jgi:hypothetical protein
MILNSSKRGENPNHMCKLHYTQGLSFVIIEVKKAQPKKKLKEARILMKPNLEIKSLQVHMLGEDALPKIVTSLQTKTIKVILPLSPYAQLFHHEDEGKKGTT